MRFQHNLSNRAKMFDTKFAGLEFAQPWVCLVLKGVREHRLLCLSRARCSSMARCPCKGQWYLWYSLFVGEIALLAVVAVCIEDRLHACFLIFDFSSRVSYVLLVSIRFRFSFCL